MESIYEAIIITSGVIIAQLGIAWRSNSMVRMRLDQIEKKQDKHNSLIERLTICEVKINNLEKSENGK